MKGHNHMHGAVGIFAIVAAIAFAFGQRTAQVVVGSVLIAGLLFFAYLLFRVAMETI